MGGVRRHVRIFVRLWPTPFYNASAVVVDLTFNAVPPSDERKKNERAQFSDTKPEKLRRKRARQDEIEFFTNALKRLRADYPPSESPSPPKSSRNSMTSRGDFQPVHRADAVNDMTVGGETNTTPRHRGGGGSGTCSCGGRATHHIGGENELSPQHGSHASRGCSIRSDPVAIEAHPSSSSSSMLNTLLPPDGSFGGEIERESATKQQGFEAAASCEQKKPPGRNAVEPPKYEDKGVMASRVRRVGCTDALHIPHGSTKGLTYKQELRMPYVLLMAPLLRGSLIGPAPITHRTPRFHI
ncbi:hypothetical protein Trco_005543 [Trichoderma cornu-damae]|uniref:Uncharacterized protein n=1 Tax=Trichoderma cornu-damae TaxID=654480 RepID=A0A9P8QN64_9HYPO|nr:hypothetical protein Trco_005543 [Trichoderma cornu-damae]